MSGARSAPADGQGPDVARGPADRGPAGPVIPLGLAAQQAALVAALVDGGQLPTGFDEHRLAATRAALLRKRAGEVAAAWPLLAASYGAVWPETFAAWAATRPPNGALRDGWDFANAAGDALPPLAREELSAREREMSYDGTSAPRRKRRAALLYRLGVLKPT